VPTFADRGWREVGAADPCGRNLGFLKWSRYYVFRNSYKIVLVAQWTPFQTHYFSENLVAPGIEPTTAKY
jgi:hypothetical protein